MNPVSVRLTPIVLNKLKSLLQSRKTTYSSDKITIQGETEKTYDCNTMSTPLNIYWTVQELKGPGKINWRTKEKERKTL